VKGIIFGVKSIVSDAEGINFGVKSIVSGAEGIISGVKCHFYQCSVLV